MPYEIMKQELMKMTSEDFQLLKPEEVAKILKVSKATPYSWARRGILPFYRLEGVLRFKIDDVRAFVESRRGERRG